MRSLSVSTTTQNQREEPAIDQDIEVKIVSHLIDSVTGAGICNDPVDVVNIYVALKSKPLLILYGPQESGKSAFVHCLARILIGGDCAQCQMLTGHPWSAENSGNVAFFTGLHYRYNTEKMLSLIEEAWRPENRYRIFMACLTRISPAEIIDSFSSLSRQLINEHINRIGDIDFYEPIPFPPNLWIIGTMDRVNFDWWEEDLLSRTFVVHWPKADHRSPNCPDKMDNVPDAQVEVLLSIQRMKNEVYKKFHTISARLNQPLQSFFELKSVLAGNGITLGDNITDETTTFLANSWSRNGGGLFHPSNQENLSIALDLAITQILLPRIRLSIHKSIQLKELLVGFFSAGYPRSRLFLTSI